MKTISISLIILVISTSLFAQNDTIVPDTTYINFKKKKIIIIDYEAGENKDFEGDEEPKERDGFNPHFASFELGLNTYLTADQSMSLGDDASFLELEDSKSFEFSVNLFDFGIPIVRDRFGLVSGMGVTWNNYKFDNKSMILQNDTDYLSFIIDDSTKYSKNKLTTLFLNVPVMFEIHIPTGGKDLWIAAGVYGGVKLGSYVKLKTEDDDKEKIKEDFHLNSFRYGVRAQVGYGDFGFYCNYSLQSMFKKDEGPELYPLSVGLTLAFD